MSTSTETGNGSSTDTSTGRGFPENTPVEDMTVEEQAAYWRHHARKHEDRLKKQPSPAELRQLREQAAELERLQEENASADEKALKAARKEGASAERTRLGQRLAAAELKAAAAGKVAGFEALVEDLNLSKFVGEDGEPDAEAITATVERLIALAPAQQGGQEEQRQAAPDLEQGPRPAPDTTPSVQSGRDLYANFRK
jgi:hypothetical protein